MITLSMGEILRALSFSSLYGALFSLFRFVFGLFVGLCAELFGSIYRSVKYQGQIFRDLPPLDRKIKEPCGALYTFFSVVLFFFGMILVNYLSLDGEFRIYTLLVCLASLFLFDKILAFSLKKPITLLILVAFSGITALLRLILFPIRAAALFLRRTFREKISKITK